MLNKPEEFIMAVLAIVWIVITFFITRYINLTYQAGLMVTGLTLLWALCFFLLWRRDWTRFVWPLFLGLFVACWLPALHDYSWQVSPDNVLIAPWYVSKYFQIILVSLPIVLGYLYLWHAKNEAKRATIK